MKPCMLAFTSFLLILICCAEAYSGAALLFGSRKVGPSGSVGEEAKRYAVVFDAGSTGSRVHVFCFDPNLDLVNIGDDIELFVQVKPGLSAYADDPQAAADSLIPLLVEAKKVVPEELQPKTPVRLGATAGLRNLGEDTSNEILEAVRNLLQESSLEYKPEWVTVLAGSQEGSYLWVAMNFLLGNLGKNYASTVGVLDLGGGSVQMSYAISEEASANAPVDRDDPYVQPKLLNGTAYNLYTHSYLNYGLMAARAEILKVSNGIYSYCILSGYEGSYEYGNEVFNASASPFGSSYHKCRSDGLRALKIDAACAYIDCTFGGIWSGGGGAGQKNMYVASYFFDRASEAGIVDPDAPAAKVRPSDFKHAAKRACSLTLEDAKATYPAVSENDLPYFCMDLVYQYTLLVDGFGLSSRQEITLVRKVKYAGSYVEAAWPLGSAIEVVSGNSEVASLKSTLATATKDLLCSWLPDHQFCSSGVNGL